MRATLVCVCVLLTFRAAAAASEEALGNTGAVGAYGDASSSDILYGGYGGGYGGSLGYGYGGSVDDSLPASAVGRGLLAWTAGEQGDGSSNILVPAVAEVSWDAHNSETVPGSYGTYEAKSYGGYGALQESGIGAYFDWRTGITFGSYGTPATNGEDGAGGTALPPLLVDAAADAPTSVGRRLLQAPAMRFIRRLHMARR